MSDKKDWQDANRERLAEERRGLGDPPTAEEMLAFYKGELSESEADRIRELIAAYPELARMYSEPFPEEPRLGDPDFVPANEIAASYAVLQRRLHPEPVPSIAARERSRFRHYIPATFAAMFALVFFGLYVRAESRARYYEQQELLPRVLGAPQELQPDGSRGPGSATVLRKDGGVYLLKPRLINQVRYAHYQLTLHDAGGTSIWADNNVQPGEDDDAFQVIIPHAFLTAGETYQLRIFGVDGESSRRVGSYDVTVPAE